MGEPWKDSLPCTGTLWQVNDQEGLSLTPWLCSVTKGTSSAGIQTQEATAQKPASSHLLVTRSKPDPGCREPGVLCSSRAMAKPKAEPGETSSPLCSLSPKAVVFVFTAGTTVTALSHPSSPPAPQPRHPPCGATPSFLGSQPGCAGGLPSPLPPQQAQQPTEEIPEAQGKLGAKSGSGPSLLLADKGRARAALGAITRAP